VTLSFHEGIELKDPDGLLRGTGKTLRHIRVERLAELERPAIRRFLRQARRLSPLKRKPRTTPDDVITRIKEKPADRKAFPRMF